MKESDYREVENAVAETLRVFLESKQKLTSFERTCRDSLMTLLGEVVRRRGTKSPIDQTIAHEG